MHPSLTSAKAIAPIARVFSGGEASDCGFGRRRSGKLEGFLYACLPGEAKRRLSLSRVNFECSVSVDA